MVQDHIISSARHANGTKMLMDVVNEVCELRAQISGSGINNVTMSLRNNVKRGDVNRGISGSYILHSR